MMEDRVRVEEAARFTKVHSVTVKGASDREKLPAARDYRNHRRFSLGDLIEWKRKRAQLRGGDHQKIRG